MNLKIISAGAGSGKTYRLTSEMLTLLKSGLRASGIIATTFTKKAAAELQERVRVRLLEEGLTEQADELTNALIGTVHGLGVKLLKRFAFEAGVSPEVDIIADEDTQIMFNNALATILTQDKVEKMEALSDKLGLNKKGYYDWRSEVMRLTEVARANDFSADVLELSKKRSFDTFKDFLGENLRITKKEYNKQLAELLQLTIQQLENNDDHTKTTKNLIGFLKSAKRELNLRDELYWWQLVKISKAKPGAKSKDDIEELSDYAQKHEQLLEFQNDIQNFIELIFELSMEAIREYDEYKKRRGLIDYTDMEVHIKKLLKHPMVQEVLAEELDLLMVDEFQDTSPIQLEIFLKLSKFAKYSIWVGDPKQSIYGFRGAEPQLMQAIIEKIGGVKPEDIQEYSWRSREDIVYATNALFTKAFEQLPVEQVALKPKRCKKATSQSSNKEDEPFEMGDALMHWHFQFDGGKRLPGKPWMENCIAQGIKQLLEGQSIYVFPKDEKDHRLARPGDIAILCRSNQSCQEMAEALHKAGLKAAIARNGLLHTAEAKLVLACMKFVLNQTDSLSIAEILLLAGQSSIEEIIENRLQYLQHINDNGTYSRWAADNPFVQQLNVLREQVVELSSTEILNLMLEDLDLRRIIVSWGNTQQRLGNVDVLRKLAVKYEESCNRLHTAASLGGFLLWLNELESSGKDMQSSGENENAINVLTYHKSKGLEWPIVICHSLENPLRSDVWGVNIVAETEEVDLDNVLGNRWLRYWVNPYADQFSKTLLEERINQSPIKSKTIEKALQEEARLLYVGITRARDYLIFPTRPRYTKWLNRVWHQGNEAYLTLAPNTYESPWEWNNQFLNIYTETFLFPKDFPYTELPQASILFLEEGHGKKEHKTYHIDLNKEHFSQEAVAKIGTITQYTSPLRIKNDEVLYTIAKAFKAFLTADHLDYNFSERETMAAAIIRRYGIEDAVQKETFLKTSQNWWTYLNHNFTIQKIHRKYPVYLQYGNRLFNTIIDLLLETDEGLLLIQNTGFGGDSKKWRNKALELGSWCYFSRLAVQQITGQQEVKTFVHFVLKGGLIEVLVPSS